ncbi:MAG: hypothetical protein ACHP7O_14775, partial [Burkholderiales bacterium]
LMTPLSDKCATRQNEHYTLRITGDVDSAIDLIFDAFENTPLHHEAVKMAKEKAAASYIGEQRERALSIIEQLGHLMDRQHWEKKNQQIL